MEKQPDEPEDVTNEPLPMSEPMEVQDAVASTLATPFAHAQPIIAASKSKAQKQREYRQRIAASRTPAQAAAAREARNVRDRNNRLRQAANLAIASGSLEATTTSSSRSGQRLNTVHIDTQQQFTDQQRQTLATEPAETTVQPSTSSDQIEVQAQSTWNTKWASSIMRFKSTFLDNDFCYACSVCDRLWFRNDLKPITAAQLKVISDWFIKENRQLSREEYKLVCNTCKKSLNKQLMPPLAKVNGFSYPDPPPGLLLLDPTSVRLISPRLPFMQVRRLSHDFSYGIVGQVINIPVDVQEMLCEGGICEICTSRLRDACDFKRQVQAVMNEDAEYEIKQEEVDLPIDIVDDDVKTEPPDFSDEGMGMEQDPLRIDVKMEVEGMEMGQDPLASPEEWEPKASDVLRTDVAELNMYSNEDNGIKTESPDFPEEPDQPKTSLPRVTSTFTLTPGSKRLPRILMCNRRVKARPSPVQARLPPVQDRFSPVPVPKSPPPRLYLPSEIHVTNVQTLIQHSNCTPFLTRTQTGIQCCYCEVSVPNLAVLREHMQSAHSNVEYRMTKMHCRKVSCKIDITDLKCKLCEQNFDVLSSLKKHLIAEHAVKFIPEKTSNILEFKLSGNGEVLTCAHCSCSYATFKMLLQHMNVHYRNFICELCKMGFLKKYALVQHMSTHKTGNFECSICARQFTTYSKYRSHRDTSHKNVECELCDQTFRSYATRNIHILKYHKVNKSTNNSTASI